MQPPRPDQGPHARMPRDLESALRREGLRIKGERARGHVGLRIWAGDLGAERASPVASPAPAPSWGQGSPTGLEVDVDVAHFSVTAGESLDHQDRVQVALCLTHLVRPCVPRPRLWLTRSGSPDPCPEDWRWLAAASEAWHVLGLAPDYAVITREGWSLVPSGLTRRWRRLRA